MIITRRKLLKTSAAAGAAGLAAPYFFTRAARAADAVEVGVLFSLTGGLSIIEKSLADATKMAIDEINAEGGVMGKMIKPIVEDGASDPKTYNEKASKLVAKHRRRASEVADTIEPDELGHLLHYFVDTILHD